MSAPQKPEKKASSSAIRYRDVAWKLQELIPEVPKRDGSAEEYLRKIGMAHEQFACDTLVVTEIEKHGACAICKREEKPAKFCRIKQNGTFCDISICTNCINVFVEYNPKSVYNFEAKETK